MICQHCGENVHVEDMYEYEGETARVDCIIVLLYKMSDMGNVHMEYNETKPCKITF